MEKTMLAVKYYSKLTVHWSPWVQILPAMTKRKKRSSLDLHGLSSWRSLIPVLVVKRSKATVWDANASQVTPPPFQKKKISSGFPGSLPLSTFILKWREALRVKWLAEKKQQQHKEPSRSWTWTSALWVQCTYNVFHNNWRSPHYLYHSKGCCTLRVGCQYVIKQKGGTS